MASGCTIGRRPTGVDIVMVQANVLLGNPSSTFMWRLFDPYHLLKHGFRASIPLPVLHSAAPHNSSGLVWGTSQRAQGVHLAFEFGWSHTSRTYVECTGRTTPINRGPTSQLTRPEGSDANVLVPDTRGHLPQSCEVHATTRQSCLGCTRTSNTTLGRWFKCFGYKLRLR